MIWRRTVTLIAIMVLLGALVLSSSGVGLITAGGPREPLAPTGGGPNTDESVADRPVGPSGTLERSRAEVIRGTRLGISPPARRLPRYQPPAHPQQVEPVDEESFGATLGTDDVRDAALQRSVGTQSMPAADDDFAGISATGYVPPDTIGDVGPDHYVQAVNVAFRIWNKDGTPVTGDLDISSLFVGSGNVCETTDQGDPIVQYDHLSDRWLISQFAFDVNLSGAPIAPFYQCIAVSTGADPAGTYHRYAFEWPEDRFNDYPKIGVWPDGYYMSANEFSANGKSYLGVGVAALERDAMLSGAPADMLYFHLANDYSLLPGDLDGWAPPPPASPNTFASIDDAFLATRKLRLFEFHADFATPANSTFTALTPLTPAAYDPNIACTNGGSVTTDCVSQPDTNQRLDALPDRLMWRLAYRNYGTHQTIAVNHTVDVNGNNKAGVRWYELRNSGASWSIYQQGTYSPDGKHRWMGSAALDANGNMAIGYSTSRGNTYPRIDYAGRLATDPLGELSQGEATLKAGGGSQTTSARRWGDYSSMNVDPEDDCTFWYTNEYYKKTSRAGWKTRIGHFRFPECEAGGSFSVDDVTVAEGDAGTSIATFTVTAAPTTQQPVTVDYDTGDGSATDPSDYLSTSGQLAFGAGEATKTIDVTINGDTDYEQDEDFSVDLSNATVGATIADAQGTGTITNDDPVPPGFTIDDVTVAEGTGGTTDAIFTVSLTPASGSTQTVDVDTADDSATAPDDYTAVSQTLTFDPGDTSKPVTVEVVGDTDDEPDEDFLVDLSNGSMAVIEAQGEGTILDDDEPPGACTITGTEGDDELPGTPGDDVICGLGGNDTIDGGGGNDTIDGGADFDVASYANAPSAVTVDLSTGMASGGDGNDTLAGIEDVAGSDFADSLTGNDETNYFYGRGGKDTMVGRGGLDLVSYENADAKVSVNLKKGQASGGEGKDTISGIEDITGSNFKDTLAGKNGSSFLYGLGGGDSLSGNGGADGLYGDAGNDTFNGGKGFDICSQGSGSGTKRACEANK